MALPQRAGGRKNFGPKRDFVYHGALTKASPVRLTIDGDVRTIRTKRPGESDPWVVDVTIHGDDGSKTLATYMCENEACAGAFDQTKGITGTFEFTGSRDEAAVALVGDAEEAAASQERESAPARPQTPATQRQPASPAAAHAPASSAKSPEFVCREAKVFAARRVSLLKVATRGILRFRDDYNAARAAAAKADPNAEPWPEFTRDDFWHRVGSLNLSLEAEGLAIRAGFADALPVALDFATLLPPAEKPPVLPSTIRGKAAAVAKPEPPPLPKCKACNAEVESVDAAGKCPACVSDDVPF